MLFHKTVPLSRPVKAAYCKVGHGKHTFNLHHRRKTSMDEAKNVKNRKFVNLLPKSNMN